MAGYAQDKDGLTERQRAFVSAYVANGGKLEKAAIEAGYAEGGARTRAYDLMRMPKVQAAIRLENNQQMGRHASSAIEVLKELMEKADSETVKAACAQSLLDRSGYKLPEQLVVTDNRTAADVERDLAILLGIAGEEDTDTPGKTDGEGVTRTQH